MVGYGGKDLRKRKALSLEWKSEGVMDDESGESMEPMEEVPYIIIISLILVFDWWLVYCIVPVWRGTSWA